MALKLKSLLWHDFKNIMFFVIKYGKNIFNMKFFLINYGKNMKKLWHDFEDFSIHQIDH